MPPIQTSYSERPRIGLVGDVVNMETANSISRIIETVAGIAFGQPVVQGATDNGVVLADSTAYAAVAAAKAGNTGNGTITGAPPAGAGVMAGVYQLINIGKDANLGTFEMFDPNGVLLGRVEVGVATTLGGVGPFTIADGATDWDEGDGFNITVTASTGGGRFEGITIRDVTLQARGTQTVDLYQQRDTAGVLNKGVIYVLADAAIVRGAQAYYNSATKRFTSNAANYRIPNAIFDSSAANAGDLVELRLNNA